MCIIPTRPPRRAFDVDVWLEWKLDIRGGPKLLRKVLKTRIHVKASMPHEAAEEAALQYYRGLVMKIRVEVPLEEGSSVEYFEPYTLPPQASKGSLKDAPRGPARKGWP